MQALLVLDSMLDAVRPDGAVPLVPLEPAVLHDVRAPAAVAFKRLEHGDIVRVAHADLVYDARVLQGDEGAPCDERLGEGAEGRVQHEGVEVRRAEGRVQHEGVEVRRAEVLEGGLDGRLDLGGDVGIGVVGEGLGLVLAVDGGEPAPLGVSERGRRKAGGRYALCLEKEVLSLDAVFIVEDLECCTYEILPCIR